MLRGEYYGWMTGNAPAASWTTTRRSAFELHPPYFYELSLCFFIVVH